MRPSRPQTELRPALWWSLVALFALTVLFYTTNLDQDLARAIFDAGQGQWFGREQGWARLPYQFGEIPAYAAGVLGALAFFASYRSPRFLRWRGPGLYLALLLLLGPGLIVNILAKGLTGRPRPSDLIEFGGYWPFQRPWHLGTPGQGSSFISGHVSMAFYWFALVYLLKERGQRVLAFGGTVAFGLWMGAARMTQGAHFLSDVLLCGVLMWALATALSPLILWQPAPAFWVKPKVLGALSAAFVMVFALAHPVFEQRDLLWGRPGKGLRVLATQRLSEWAPAQDLKAIDFKLSLERGDLAVDFQAQDDGQLWPLRVDEELQGFGTPNAKAKLEAQVLSKDPDALAVTVDQQLRGGFYTFAGTYHLSFPKALAVDARLKTAQGVLTIAHLPEGRQILVNGNLEAQDLPAGFHAFGERSWVRDGDQPQIALDLSAPSIRFLP